jgi:hypothetical protein
MDDAKSTTKPAVETTAAAPAKADAVDALIEAWIAPLRGSAIAQHTPAWNALTEALPALKAAIIAG